MSSSVETTEVEVLYEKQQGLKHTHTVGYHGTCAILHTETRHLHLYNTYYSPVLIPLNHFFSCGSPLLHPSHTHRSAPHLGSPPGAGLVWADTALSHGATEVEAQIFIFAPITPLFSSSSALGTRAEGLKGGTGGLRSHLRALKSELFAYKDKAGFL